MIDTESLIVGLILIDVTATLGGNMLLWSMMTRQNERLSRLEGQHAINHPGRAG